MSRLTIIVLLTLASLRLPLAFTGLLVLIELALLFVYLGAAQVSQREPDQGRRLPRVLLRGDELRDRW